MTTITKQMVQEAIDNMDDYAKMETSIDPIGARNTIEKYIRQLEAENADMKERLSDLVDSSGGVHGLHLKFEW